MDTSANTFSYFVGGLALISTISSVLLYSSAYLPKAQLRILDELLTETRSIYHKAESKGLLPHEVAVKAQEKLIGYEEGCETLREITYRAQSSNEKIRIVLQGHLNKIMRLATDVESLRATLVTTSQREKARRDLEELSASGGTTPTNDCTESNSTEVSEHTSDGTTTSHTKKLASYFHCVSAIVWWRSKTPDDSHPTDGECSSSQCSDALSRAGTLVGEIPPSSDLSSVSPVDRPVRWWWFRKSSPNSPQPGGDDSSPNKDIALLPV